VTDGFVVVDKPAGWTSHDAVARCRKVFQQKRHTARVNLRGLPKGTFIVRINVLTTEGDILKGKRTYRTCRAKRR